MNQQNHTGTLYGVGVGPGDPELITLKALHCVERCDVVVLPSEPKEDCHAYRILKQVYPQIDTKEILCKDFPMIKDKQQLKETHDRIFAELQALLEQGKNIAFITIGDPTVYSTFSYMQIRAKAAGISTETISGVPSFCAVAAALGVSLADNKAEIHVIPGSYGVEDTLTLSGTKVYMKSGKKAAELKRYFAEQGLAPEKVMAVSNCGMDNETIYRSLEEWEPENGYLTTVIVKE